jgi:hypothetical protein
MPYFNKFNILKIIARTLTLFAVGVAFFVDVALSEFKRWLSA